MILRFLQNFFHFVLQYQGNNKQFLFIIKRLLLSLDFFWLSVFKLGNFSC